MSSLSVLAVGALPVLSLPALFLPSRRGCLRCLPGLATLPRALLGTLVEALLGFLLGPPTGTRPRLCL
ncbi:hypothetical protein Mth01_07090 [Sphaerimonospora thailandensis]|uniref:Uncharacterized protein n=1 Tax=Sphaerimonospora thailandensis TaxID=795644 RepID=A0A8J3R3E7_9ACTN|nr:hypothetical protein Mth01_07090 [Sphaerimonospora thailandensis]